MNTNMLDLILHPVRMRIIMAIAGQALTASDLAKELDDVPQATLYRHINQLYQAGILELLEERRVRNTIERVFTLKSGSTHAGLDDLTQLTAEEHLQYFSGFLLTLIDDFSRYLQKADLPLELAQVGYQKIPLHLSQTEFTDLNKSLNDAILPFLAKKPSADRQRRIFALITIPEIKRPEQSAVSKDVSKKTEQHGDKYE